MPGDAGPSSPRPGGSLLVFDGGEGCGKSTQSRLLKAHLEAQGRVVHAFRDPGTTRIGEQLRSILLNPDHAEMGMRCEMLLYMAARAQMMTQSIRPALRAGEVVICDRFVSSTLAYQLGGEDLSADDILAVARVALRDRTPDLVVILDMPVEQSVSRVRSKFEHRRSTLFGQEVETTKDRIERRPIEYHRRVRQNYLDQARADPARYRVVRADQSVDEVQAEVRAAVGSALPGLLGSGAEGSAEVTP